MKWSCGLALAVFCGCAEETAGTDELSPAPPSGAADVGTAPPDDMPRGGIPEDDASAADDIEAEQWVQIARGANVYAAAIDRDPDGTQTRRVHLGGALQKGPFVAGSAVSAANLDARGRPTGARFSTSTHDDLGNYELDFDATALISVEGTGLFYNEATGALSATPITLRALGISRLNGERRMNVNIITHVTFDRTLKLIGEGASFEQARERAELELESALGLAPAGFSAGVAANRMNLLGGDTDANSYLFAVSAVLAYAAQITDYEGQAAALQQLLDGLAGDLAGDGELDASRLAGIDDARLFLETEVVEAALAERLSALRVRARIPDLDRTLDHDADGLANANDNCQRMPNADQADADGDGRGDVCDDALPHTMLCVYVPAIVAGVVCDASSLFLQCAGLRMGTDDILRSMGGSIGWIYDDWQTTPDFPQPDCASTNPDALPAPTWLTRITLDESENPVDLAPIRALSEAEFESLPHPEDAPDELIFDDELLPRLARLEAAAP